MCYPLKGNVQGNPSPAFFFVSGVNSAISSKVKPSPKIFNITSSVCSNRLVLFQALNLCPTDTIIGIKDILAFSVFSESLKQFVNPNHNCYISLLL